MSKAGVLAGIIVLLGTAWAAGDGQIILRSRRFVPPAGLDEALRRPASTVAGRMHVLIQLEGIPTVERRADFCAAGVKLLSYIPQRAWLASIPADQAQQVAELAGVRAVCAILLQDKLAAALRETGVNACSRTAGGAAKLTARLFPDVALDAGAAVVEGLGGRVISRDPQANYLVFHLPPRALDALAAWDGVQYIDQHYAATDWNDGVRTAIGVNAVQAPPYNLSGAGVLIGQWEATGHPDANHVDLMGRITCIDDGAPVSDHATLVAGTMIGDGSLLPSRLYRGMAPRATLVSHVMKWDYGVSDLRRQYQEAIKKYGIDIANNSWGWVEWHIYKDYTGVMDDIVRGALGKRISMVWAGGNVGGWGTIQCTALGKNVVTVGATNSDDNSLWALSSRGPTEDGRIKPDVVSPGCETGNGRYIWSTLPGNRYGGSCGTSLAAPSVSGTMALILEDWRGTHPADPLPATLKGILLHTATDLGDPGPDYCFGFGLINAPRAVDLVRADTLEEVIVEDAIGGQEERDLYEFEVPPGAKELKISLVWDDYPADPLTAHALVNDLDLLVTDPNGQRHYPWSLDPYEPNLPAGRTLADHANNVEQVFVETPAAGVWRVSVWGTSVPQGEQTYTLLGSGGSFAPLPAGTVVFAVTGTMGAPVAEFDDAGNLFLQGSLTTHADCPRPPGAFLLLDSERLTAGYIDGFGNLCLRAGLSELSFCTASRYGFVVQDGFGNTLASIDASGNLCLAGRLYQSP